MKILVTNDDGINAEGIKVLAELALQFGEVTVVAPKDQCSAMSHRITFSKPLTIEEASFPVEGVRSAWQVDGTPADCVKAGIECVFGGDKPDIVFSGINNGFNVGTEILYSGTVGAAMDALVYDVPAIAYSVDMNKEFSAIRHFFKSLTEEVLSRDLPRGEIWNINVPGLAWEEISGVRYERFPAAKPYYHDYYEIKDLENGTRQMHAVFSDTDTAPEGSDIEALIQGCISVGRVRSMVV